MKSNVLLRLFTLDHFLVFELEARLFAISGAQDNDVVLLCERSETACLCDQLQHGSLRVERIRARPDHFTRDEGAFAMDLSHGDGHLGIVEKVFELFSNQVLNLQRSET